MVVVGSGFGGLFAVRALRRADVDVTVIDRKNHHLFQPLLYQVATGILSEGEVAPAIRDVLARYPHVEVLLADVVDIDLQDRCVVSEMLGEQVRTPYDSLVVAAGTRTSYFGRDEFSAHAPGLKTIEDAHELRARILGAFEMAEREPDPERVAPWLTFVVVGAGPTGVEMAGQISELARRTLPGQFRRIRPEDARVVLLDGADAVLGSFGSHLSGKAAAELRRLGVEIHLGAMVQSVDADGVVVNGLGPGPTRIEAKVKVWAAGVHGESIGEVIANKAGLPLDRHGRVPVDPDCRLPGHPEVWVVGDLMALGDLPGVAEVAMQSGRHAARAIAAEAESGTEDRRPFRYRDLGSMASVSRFRAVASIGPLRVAGVSGWLLWAFVHLVFLTGFKNRVAALAHWTVSFLGKARAQRAFSQEQIVGRNVAGSALVRDHQPAPPPEPDAQRAGPEL